MRNKIFLRSLAVLFMCFFAGIALAQHQHDHGGSSPAASSKDTSQEMQMGGQPVQAITLEGLKITFEVMDMSMQMSMPGMKGNPQHGGPEHSQSHALMVTVQDTTSKEIISDARVQYALTRPSKEKETGELIWSGDHYGGGFTLKEKGFYQFQLGIESGGMDREAKFTYEFK